MLQILQNSFCSPPPCYFKLGDLLFPLLLLPSITNHCCLATIPCFWPPYSRWTVQNYQNHLCFPVAFIFFAILQCLHLLCGKADLQVGKYSFKGVFNWTPTSLEDLNRAARPLYLFGMISSLPPLDRSSATFSIRVQWKAFDRPASSPHYRMRVD